MPTPKRHEANDGTVSYRVRFRIAGSSKSETFDTRKNADRFVKLIEAVGPARARAVVNETRPDEVLTHTVGAVCDLWLKWKSEKKKDGQLRRVRSGYTITKYEQIIRGHIKPTLGDKPINLVTEADIQRWVDDLADELAPKTVGDAHALLHSVYTWAAAKSRGLAIIDPCTDTDLPKKQKKPPKGLRPGEWQLLHQAAVAVDQDSADLLLFLVSTGWRWSEAVAVRAVDVDDYGDKLFATMGRILRRNGNRFEFVDDESKSEAGFRHIRITGAAADMVRRRREGLAPDDLLFTNSRGSRWYYSHFHAGYWSRGKEGGHDRAPKRKRILEVAAELGLTRTDITPHVLRHTHVGMLILAGENLPAIQRRIGHEDIRTTVNVYGSMITDVSDETLDAVDAMLLDGGARGPGALTSG